ncbi:MAG: hypothetical protein ACAH21_07870 [Ramlibacter sp.]|nr:hypothetical protein [Ramlibacter sp.]
MNIAANHPFAAAPQPLFSATAHIALAVIVACVLALVLIGARSASHDAMKTASVTFKQAGPTSVKLAPVQIVGRREAGDRKKI